MISPATRERLVGEIAAAESDGLPIVRDGREADAGAGGAKLGPTIVDNVPPEHRIATEELFGSVLSVFRVDIFEDALASTNASRLRQPQHLVH